MKKVLETSIGHEPRILSISQSSIELQGHWEDLSGKVGLLNLVLEHLPLTYVVMVLDVVDIFLL